MEEVIVLSSPEEQEQFSEVSSYCFFDRTGWTGRLFRPGVFRGTAYGCREKGRVMSGVLSFDLTMSYWGRKDVLSSGVGCVASDPAVRNKGHIRRIMNRLLRDGYARGEILSFLYPFSYRYYGMFGYGTMGHYSLYKFNPEELITREAPEGEYTRFDRSEKQYREFLDLKNEWALRFHGGVEQKFENTSLDYFLGEMDRDRRFLYFYRNGEGAARGCLLYKMEEGRDAQAINIIRAAWSGAWAFRALTHFLWRHRGQVGEVFWPLPLSVPLEMMTGEPRIYREDRQSWMGRPVNVAEALKIKSAYMPVRTPFSFSLSDPVIPENSGTYRLEGESVGFERDEFTAEELDFSVFSAMILGGLSLDEAKLAGRIGESFQGDPEYLSRLENIFITESF
ncbi:MAG: GNAT family N-acetyltransferase [Spirochaetales bacterium]|nr:GNAT family N-acetyltransferase [Spirochaetales bacterium]